MTLTDLLPRPLRRIRRPHVVEMAVTPEVIEVKVVPASSARQMLDPEIAAREATLARAEAFRSTMFCPARLRRI